MQQASSLLPSHSQAPDDQFKAHLPLRYLQTSEPHDSDLAGAHDEAPASAGEAASTAGPSRQAQVTADGPDELKAEACQPKAKPQQPHTALEGHAHSGEAEDCGAISEAARSDGRYLQHTQASSSCSATPGKPDDRQAAASSLPDVAAEAPKHGLARPLTGILSLPAARHDTFGTAPGSLSISDGRHVRLGWKAAPGNEQVADFGPAAGAKLPFVAISCNPLYTPTAAASRSPPHSPPHLSPPLLGPTSLPDTCPAEQQASLHLSNAQALMAKLGRTPGSAFQPRCLFSSATRHRPWQHKPPADHDDRPEFGPCAGLTSSPAADSHRIVSSQLRPCCSELNAGGSRPHLQHGKQEEVMRSSQAWHHRGTPRKWGPSAALGMPSLLDPRAGQVQSAHPSSRAFSTALHTQATNVREIAALSAHMRGTASAPEQPPSLMGAGDEARSHSRSTPLQSAELALLRETHRLQGMPSTIETAGRRSSPEGRLKAAMQRLARVHARQSQVLSHF